MVSNSNRPRPLWILKIHKRLSINKFKRDAQDIATEDDICYVLKAKDVKKNVYQVTVETMENCETSECEKIMWVPEQFVQTTGEMFEKFEEEEERKESPEPSSIDDVSDGEESEEVKITEEIEQKYEKMRDAESFDPYAPDSDDDDGDDVDELIDFTGLANETVKEVTI